MELLKKILFVVLLGGIIGGELLRYDNGQSIAVTFMDITVVLLVGSVFVINLFQKKPLTITKIHKFAMWFVGIGFVSLLLEIFQLKPYQFFVSLLYAIRFILYTLGISWSVQLLNAKFKKVIPYFLFGTSSFLGVIGLMQYVWYPELRNLYYAGWDPHLYRVFATFLDPNFVGLFYILGIILGIYIVFDNFKKKTIFMRVSLIGLTLLSILALFLTYSRGAYLAFLISLIVILWRMGLRKFILTAFGVLVMLIVIVEVVSPKSEGTKLLRTASIRDRLVSLQQVTTIILHHPFLGVGFDAYRYAQDKEGFLLDKVATTHSGAGTDNSFLFAFATTGFAGLFSYTLMTWQILKVSYQSKTLSGRTLFASYIALIVGSFFVNALFYPFLLVWIWILVGILNTY